MDWTDKAACQRYPIEMFYPEPGPGTGGPAKLICGRCSVRSECLDFAIRTNQEHGIWGGMNTRERREYEDNALRKVRSVL